MSRVVFLLEEPSMKVLLEGFLPRLAPGMQFLCIAHEGKQDLEKSIPRKLRAWREPGVHFVIVRDNDGGDCRSLKIKLVQLCKESGRTDTLVRIACQELEAWYLGQPEALAAAYSQPGLMAKLRRAKFRHPDAIPRPSETLAGLIPEYQKVLGARKMSSLLAIADSRSQSFNAFVAGVRRIAAGLAIPRHHAHEATSKPGDD